MQHQRAALARVGGYAGPNAGRGRAVAAAAPQLRLAQQQHGLHAGTALRARRLLGRRLPADCACTARRPRLGCLPALPAASDVRSYTLPRKDTHRSSSVLCIATCARGPWLWGGGGSVQLLGASARGDHGHPQATLCRCMQECGACSHPHTGHSEWSNTGPQRKQAAAQSSRHVAGYGVAARTSAGVQYFGRAILLDLDTRCGAPGWRREPEGKKRTHVSRARARACARASRRPYKHRSGATPRGGARGCSTHTQGAGPPCSPRRAAQTAARAA